MSSSNEVQRRGHWKGSSTDKCPLRATGTYAAGTRMNVSCVVDTKQIVLYLLPSERFLFLGYEPRQEHWSAVGHWHQHEARVELIGRGSRDPHYFSANCYGPRFHRTFNIEAIEDKQRLTGTQLEEWGVLGSVEKLYVLGREAFVKLRWTETNLLPQRWQDIDSWVVRLLELQHRI
jgi:hypothetical protein